MKRTPLKRVGQPRHTRPLRGRSRRNLAYAEQLAAVTPSVLSRARWWCEAGLPGCDGHAAHVHHRKLRSQGGGNDPSNLLAVCQACHAAAHRDPERAYRAGLLVEAWRDPAQIPVEREAW